MPMRRRESQSIPVKDDGKSRSGRSGLLGRLGRAWHKVAGGSRRASSASSASSPAAVTKLRADSSVAIKEPRPSSVSFGRKQACHRADSHADSSIVPDQSGEPLVVQAAIVSEITPCWITLPADLIQKIISILPPTVNRSSVRCVCKAWAECVDAKTLRLRPKGPLTPPSLAVLPSRFSGITALDLSEAQATADVQAAVNCLLQDPGTFPSLHALVLPLDWLPRDDRGSYTLDVLSLASLRHLTSLELPGPPVPPSSAPPSGPVAPPVCLPAYTYRQLKQHAPSRLSHLRITHANLHNQTSAADLISALATTLPSLPSLHLPSNAIPLLPYSLSRLAHLHTLDLSSNILEWFPAVLSSMPHLLSLSLSHNLIPTCPTSLSTLTALRHLDLSHNPLPTSVPPALLSLTALTSLNLSHAPLTKIPPSLTLLSSLRHLDLSHNKIATFDPPLTSLPSLVHLNLSSNRLSHLRTALPAAPPLHTSAPAPPEDDSWDVFAPLPSSSLTHLDLSSNRLEAFPMIVLQLTRLETLLLDDQQGWQWYNTLPLGANGRSVREEVYRVCPHMRTYTDA